MRVSRILGYTMSRLALGLLAYLLLTGCGTVASDDRPEAGIVWHATTDSSATWGIAANNPCADCIRLTRLAEFGDTTPSGFLDYSEWVLRDSVGRFWVGQKGHLKVYDPTGALVRRVGQEGKGPMEFGRPQPVLVDARGRIHVIDQENMRETVLAADFSLDAEHRMPLQGVFNLAPLDDGTSYVSSRWAASARGLPLQVITRDSVVRSFATLADGSGDPLSRERTLATDSDDRIYAMPRFSFDVEVFSREGRRVVALTGPRLNATPPKGTPINLTDNPWPHEVLAIRVDRAGRLWVLSRRPRDDWRSHFTERRQPGGAMGIVPKAGGAFDPASVIQSRIEVVDLGQRRVVARIDRDEILSAFVGDGLVLQNLELADGTPRLAVWRVEFRDH